MDVDPQSLLLTTAELAVAFAGFASLVGVFASRSPGALSELLSDAVRSLLDYGLLAVSGCLLPFVPILAGAGDATVWAVSSGGLAGAIVAYAVLSHRWYRDLAGRHLVRDARAWFLLAGDALAVLVLVLNTGPVWTPSVLVYYASLLWLLLGAALCFRGVVEAAWSGGG